MADATDLGRVIEVLAALADPTRQILLGRLAVYGEATATVLARRASGEPAGRRPAPVRPAPGGPGGQPPGRPGAQVRGAPAALTDTAEWMNQVAAEWTARLLAIKHLAEEPGAE